MRTSSNGNIFRVAGPLCGEFTGHRWIPHKGQWCGALIFSLIWAWINGWVNNREAGDLSRHRVNYDVTVMTFRQLDLQRHISFKMYSKFNISLQESTFENVTCKLLTISFRLQYIKDQSILLYVKLKVFSWVYQFLVHIIAPKSLILTFLSLKRCTVGYIKNRVDTENDVPLKNNDVAYVFFHSARRSEIRK